MRPVSAMQGGQVLASSITLIASGVLLTRGFTGLTPARPVFLILGMILVASALLGLGLEHVEVRSVRRAPDHVLVDEFHRSRRFDHPLSLVRVRCDEFGGQRVIARLRGTDRAWRQRGWLYVLLPETDGEGADLLVSRISAVLPIAVTQRASFPDDAVTVDGLYEALRDRSTSEISTAAALHESEVGGTVAIGRSTNGSGPVTVLAPVVALPTRLRDGLRRGGRSADGDHEAEG